MGQYPRLSCESLLIPPDLQAHLPLTHHSTVPLLDILEAREVVLGASVRVEGSGWWLCMCVHLRIGCTLLRGDAFAKQQVQGA